LGGHLGKDGAQGLGELAALAGYVLRGWRSADFNSVRLFGGPTEDLFENPHGQRTVAEIYAVIEAMVQKKVLQTRRATGKCYSLVREIKIII